MGQISNDTILKEAKRLYDLGFAIHWLHKKSKRPIESGWTTGPRADWKTLSKSYTKGMNVGVRLGTPSKIKGKGYLAVIDIDIKSTSAKHKTEAEKKVLELIGEGKTFQFPKVQSGRGNGSMHFYFISPTPVKPLKAAQSLDTVKVLMPSAGTPSKREAGALTKEEIEKGIRLRPAWEIGLMGDGQQVVLPPSIHPDSGRAYQWSKPLTKKFLKPIDPAIDFKLDIKASAAEKVKRDKPSAPSTLTDFVPEVVDLSWLPIHPNIKKMIITGEGVEDRSASLLPVSNALAKAGLTENEILSVLTDPAYYLGQVGYDHAKTKDRLRAARWVHRYTVKRVMSEVSAETIFGEDIPESKPLPKKEVEANQETFNNEIYNWRDELDKTSNDNIRGTLKNVVAILDNEVGPDIIRRDVFAVRDFFNLDMPWGGNKDAAIVDDDLIQAKLWLSDNFGLEPTNKIIGEAFSIIAKRNAFDPIRERLEALPPWDGVERLDTWLIENFEAEGDPDYLAQVFRKWICAMVIRTFEPGAKFDWMPILEGAQGVGKSSFGRLLVGDQYFLDWLPDLANKDAALALQGTWCVEMGELASFRKNEIETVKAFITRTIDKVRPPYGERWLEVRRRCVFFGTTNFETYLRDDSGNRRFKPVKVGNLNFEKLKEDREQLFAEAVWLYKSGFETESTLYIGGEAKKYEHQIQSDKMVQDDSALMAGIIRDFIKTERRKEKAERFPFNSFQIRDLFEVTGATRMVTGILKNWKYDSRNVQLAGKALRSLGAKQTRTKKARIWEIDLKRV